MDFFDSILDWFYDLFVSLGLWRKKGKIVFVGLDNAGKTTLLGILKNNHLRAHPPTIHPTKEELVIEGIQFSCFDLGGHTEGRMVWDKYFPGVSAVLFLVDAADVERLPEAKKELDALLAAESLQNVPFLILGNKIDIPRCLSEEQLRNELGLGVHLTTGKNTSPKELQKRGIRPIEVFMCSIINRQGFKEGFQWLSAHIP